jgi:hypothetical protein
MMSATPGYRARALAQREQPGQRVHLRHGLGKTRGAEQRCVDGRSGRQQCGKPDQGKADLPEGRARGDRQDIILIAGDFRRAQMADGHHADGDIDRHGDDDRQQQAALEVAPRIGHFFDRIGDELETFIGDKNHRAGGDRGDRTPVEYRQQVAAIDRRHAGGGEHHQDRKLDGDDDQLDAARGFGAAQIDREKHAKHQNAKPRGKPWPLPFGAEQRRAIGAEGCGIER